MWFQNQELQQSVMEVLNMKNEKQQGVWIFEDPNEFLKAIEELQKAYNGVGQHDQ